MSSTPLTDATMNNAGKDCSNLSADKPNIRILLYTDDPEKVTTGVDQRLGLGLMINLLHAHEPAFARVCFDLVSRNSSRTLHADQKLTDVLSKREYDQIWFFGLHQVNKEPFTLDEPSGGPHSELCEDEIAYLAQWMERPEGGGRGGGVLMTGDHANPRPKNSLPSTHHSCCAEPSGDARLMSLGRALGRCVPRAGMLRKWEGSPTRDVSSSYNTQVLASGTNVEAIHLESDRVPQQLILKYFNELGEPAQKGKPHPLFLYKPEEYIQVFPDHRHEGAVIIPRKFDEQVWPQADRVRPSVVARGLDKRNGRKLNILAAYDGDRAGVGRIVADSSWHHYFTVNLANFLNITTPGSVTDQLGQFYANLAVWLSPLRRRREMASMMIQWLVNHPLMFEEVISGTPDFQSVLGTGKTAYQLLSEKAAPCEIHELLWAVTPETYRQQFETLYFPEHGAALSPLPSKQLILGSILNAYHRQTTEALASEDSDSVDERGEGGFVSAGVQQAFRLHFKMLEQNWTLANNLPVA